MDLSNETPTRNPPVEIPLSPSRSTMITQRRSIWSHRKLVMKKLSVAALLVFVFLIIGSVTGVSAAAERIAGKFANKLVFFVHVAQLYTKDPDKKLAMPVQDVEKKQIANTW